MLQNRNFPPSVAYQKLPLPPTQCGGSTLWNIQFWGPQFKRDVKTLFRVLWRFMRTVRAYHGSCKECWGIGAGPSLTRLNWVIGLGVRYNLKRSCQDCWVKCPLLSSSVRCNVKQQPQLGGSGCTLKKNLFTRGTGWPSGRLPREAVNLSLEVFKTWHSHGGCNPATVTAQLRAGGWIRWPPEVLYNLHFCQIPLLCSAFLSSSGKSTAQRAQLQQRPYTYAECFPGFPDPRAQFLE